MNSVLTVVSDVIWCGHVFEYKKDLKMLEMTLDEIAQVSGGVVDADLIISASYTVCPAFAAAMTVGYYLNKLC